MSRPTARWLLLGLLVSACQASTTRPTFRPAPEAATAEVRLDVPTTTRFLAEALAADSFPIVKLEERDGYVESGWFEFPGFTPARGRPLGPAQDKVRAWVDPGKPGPPATSLITVEVVYRALADPSRDLRELERHVGESHTARQRVLAVLRKLVVQYGDSTTVPTKAGRDTT